MQEACFSSESFALPGLLVTLRFQSFFQDGQLPHVGV